MWKTYNVFPDLKVINHGFGRSHISDVNFYYKEVILKYKHALIVFCYGDNDVIVNKSVRQAFEDYKNLVDKIENDIPNSKFIFISVKPSAQRMDYWEYMLILNEKIKTYNKLKASLFNVDLDHTFTQFK